MQRIGLAFGAIVACTAPLAAVIETIRLDLPSAPLGIFGLQWTGDYFERARIGVIAGARLHLEFNTSGSFGDFHDAADILVQQQLPTALVPFWDVRGSDLGWTGTGTFLADLSTDAFDGQELLYDPTVPLNQQLVLWFGRIVSANDSMQVLGGQFTNSYWEFDLDVVPGPGAMAMVLVGTIAGARRRR